MRLPTAFDPLEPGEIDNFAFDFTADMSTASMTRTSWTCALALQQTGTDPNPQSRVLFASPQTTIAIRNPVDGSINPIQGAFSVARIGNFPQTMIGSTYVLEATAYLSDERVLKLNSTVLCQGNKR